MGLLEGYNNFSGTFSPLIVRSIHSYSRRWKQRVHKKQRLILRTNKRRRYYTKKIPW
ncbi:hypothetical protein [Bacillus sp. 123MFChir2]|uniref:hypothetical protein n=1 Tax=Bacillus sp. 123MFChir2 TaxID=1169144 RepID=UPI0003762BD5|nr:hypothetical protein [Bacillus sp. 123MFChir2]